jgi:hypothetical protein
MRKPRFILRTLLTKVNGSFVDQACKYVTELADTTKNVTESAREEEWKAVKEATAPVLNMLPSNMASTMKTELKNAEESSKKMGEKMKEIPKVGMQHLAFLVLTCSLGGGKRLGDGDSQTICCRWTRKRGGRRGLWYAFIESSDREVEGKLSHLEIKPRTPPSGLATIVLYKHKDGCLPNFYSALPHPINTSPADWGSEPTPLELYVVMDRGRFEFRFKITIYSPITETLVFRNLFKLEKLLYLKGA